MKSRADSGKEMNRLYPFNPGGLGKPERCRDMHLFIPGPFPKSLTLGTAQTTEQPQADFARNLPVQSDWLFIHLKEEVGCHEGGLIGLGLGHGNGYSNVTLA